MTSLLTRALLVLVCGFAALSSSVAAALGLAEERILVFTALLLALLLLPFVLRPHLARPSGPVLLLCALLAVIVLTDLGGRFDPVDAKIALPMLVLLAAPNLARHLTPDALLLRLASAVRLRRLDLPLPGAGGAGRCRPWLRGPWA